MRIRDCVIVLLLAAAPCPALSQDIDQTDVTFWQSVQSSQNPAEFQAYLTAFPNGVFAELARLKIAQLGGQQAPAAGTVAAAPTGGEPLSDLVMTVQPDAPRIGDLIKITFADMPHPSSYDTVIVVAAGSPDSAGTINSDGVLKSIYASNEYTIQTGWEAGQFAPGAYEVRWLSTLYNNESRLELAARTPFEVSR